MKQFKKHYPLIILITAAFLIILPFLVTIFNAFKTEPQFYSLKQNLFPTPLSTESFSHRAFFSSASLTLERILFNTWLVSLLTAIIEGAVCAGAAYVLAIINTKATRILNKVIDFSLIFTGGYFIAAKSGMVISLGLYDSLPGMILPFTATSLGVILIRQSMKQICPNTLDAVRIEASSHFTLFWHICLPQAVPSILTVTVIAFITAWKRTADPLYFSTNLTTAADFMIRRADDYGILAATSLLSSLPLIAAFLIFKASILKTLSQGELYNQIRE